MAVARTGSLYEAARELYVSESAVSAAVKGCEQEIGYSIFIRQAAKPLSLTPTGADFVRRAEVFLEVAERFYDDSRGLGAILKGTVRFGSFSGFTQLVMPPIMRHCREHAPSIELQIDEYDLPELMKRLRDGEIDLAITYDLYNDSSIAFESLFTVHPHIGVAPEHPLAGRRSVSLAEMAGEPLVLLDFPVTKQHILRLFADRGVTPKVGYYPKSMATLSSFVSHGFGYTVFFLRSSDRFQSTVALPRLALTDDVPSHRVVLAYPRHVHLPAKTLAVIDCCKAVFSDRLLVDDLVFPG